MTLIMRTACLFLLGAGLFLLPVCAEAQGTLSPALWTESIILEVEGNTTSFMGTDEFAPEPGSEQLTGPGYDVSGSVAFGSAAPPVGTAEVTWDITQGFPSVDLFTDVDIFFGCRVIETGTPPVAVTDVPVHVVASGSVAVEDVFGSRATSFFRFQAIGTSTIIQANLDVSGDPKVPGPSSDSFSIDETNAIPIGTVALVSMSATASMRIVSISTPAMGNAIGIVDPIIEVADETIPGTTASYRDFYAIEFSPGYDAQTPVQRVTFGELKHRFGVQH